jgi:hypothetical protein
MVSDEDVRWLVRRSYHDWISCESGFIGCDSGAYLDHRVSGRKSEWTVRARTCAQRISCGRLRRSRRDVLGGDDFVAKEAYPVLGDIHYVEVKESLGFFKGKHLPIDKSRALLRDTARAAVRSFSKIRPIKCELPVTIEVDLSADPVNDPALVARADDNFRFVDLSVPGRPNRLATSI